jgi:hypothetical protein
MDEQEEAFAVLLFCFFSRIIAGRLGFFAEVQVLQIFRESPFPFD